MEGFLLKVQKTGTRGGREVGSLSSCCSPRGTRGGWEVGSLSSRDSPRGTRGGWEVGSLSSRGSPLVLPVLLSFAFLVGAPLCWLFPLPQTAQQAWLSLWGLLMGFPVFSLLAEVGFTGSSPDHGDEEE